MLDGTRNRLLHAFRFVVTHSEPLE